MKFLLFPTRLFSLWILPLLLIGWATLALLFDASGTGAPSNWLAASFCVLSLGLLFCVKPHSLGAFFVFLLFGAVLTWWCQLSASNSRNWTADVSELPIAAFNGDIVTIKNVRNFDYRSEKDFTPHWEERTYDLSKVRAADLFLSYWGSPWMTHTIASWEFEDGSHLAISIETRKEIGEEYSAVRGFFRQYELYYVVADERDVIKLRTDFRGEDVYLYRIKTSPDEARKVLVDYLEDVNSIAAKPRWYNALTTNCTTVIREHRKHVGQAKPWDWRMLANGYGDELMYEQGTIENTLPFAEMRKQNFISEKGKAAGDDPKFSERIRQRP